MDDNKNCGCKEGTLPDCAPLAMAYVPMQKWRNIYDSEVGFDRGTIFEELDKPFLGEEVTPK